MNELRPHTGLSTCTCLQCDLIRCGALDADWSEWGWIDFAGYARVAMFRLTRRDPPVWWGPKTSWMGCVPWFDRLGLALDFEGAEGADDDPAS